MKKLQKIFSVLLALSMLVCLLSVGVLADTETPDEPQNDPQTEAVQPPPTEPATQPATGDGDDAGTETPAPVITTAPADEDAQALAALKDTAIINDDASAQYATVGEAINAAEDGATIKVFGTVLWGGESEEAAKNVTITSGTSEAQAHIALNGANKYR